MININYINNIPDCNFILNNEYYNGKIKICIDPLCSCTNINFTFKNNNDINEIYSFDLDILKNKIVNSKNNKLSTNQYLFAEKFINELNSDDWNLLKKIFSETKSIITEKYDPNKIIVNFDWKNIETNGAMIGYLDILPYGEQITFEYDSDIYYVDDIYCVKHNCQCTGVYLDFYKLFNDSKKINPKNFQTIMIDYKTKKYEIQKDINKSVDVNYLTKELLRTTPELLNILKKRHLKLKTIYNNFLKRENIQLNIVVNDKINIKNNIAGRNDLCPCGSGEKYKKCCLNK